MAKKRRAVDKREDAIKKKLTAAVMMLLVSCIMVVTSTYAWFTLSTAPEVTGIQTTIGGNGNLEIALAGYYDKNGNGVIETADGDYDTWAHPETISTIIDGKNKTTLEKNITWGNLIQLGDDYGLNLISLSPAQLALATGGGKVSSNLLDTPTYGADGRVDELKKAISGIFDGNSFGAVGHGVRGIGNSSSMTDRQYAYNAAVSLLEDYIDAARSDVQKSLQLKGGDLAQIAITHATNSPNDTYNEADKAAIGTLLTSLQSCVGNIKQAIISAADAYAASSESGLTDAQYKIAKAYIYSEAFSKLVDESKDFSAVNLGTGLPSVDLSAIATPITNYQTALANVSESMGKYSKLESKSSYKWDEISGTVNTLINANGVLINGIGAKDITSKAGDLATSVLNTGKLVVELSTGSGLYYDQIAKLIGDYYASITIREVSYGESLKLENIPANITTTAVSNPELKVLLTAVSDSNMYPPAETGGSETVKITNLYGYALDLIFRTNASNAKLLLSEATQRIDGDSTNIETMGHGSQFTISQTNLTTEQMVNLFKAIGIVFIDDEHNVLANAGLEPSADGLSAKLRVIDDAATAANNGEVVFAATDEITTLPQNKAKQITVLVYLDGNKVTNADVANAANSIVGQLNLQFKTDVPLQPMNYADLMGDPNANNGSGTATQLAAPSNLTFVENTLSFGEVENASSYDIYAGETKLGSTTETSVDITSLAGFASLANSAHEITVIAVGDGTTYTSSTKSAPVSYTKK